MSSSDEPSRGRGGLRPGSGRPVETATIRKGEVYQMRTPAGVQDVAVVEVGKDSVTFATRGAPAPVTLQRTDRSIPRLDWSGLLDTAGALTAPQAEASSRGQATWFFNRRVDEMLQAGATVGDLGFRVEGDALQVYYDGFPMDRLSNLHPAQVEPLRSLMRSRLTELA